MTNTISAPVSNGVTLGSGNYGDRLTITSTGVVAPVTPGQTAVYSAIYGTSIHNSGIILGGDAGDQSGETGGAGVFLAGGTLQNYGAIGGGMGGGNGAFGGDGVSLVGGALTDEGTINGGFGGDGVDPGYGGDGVYLNGGIQTNAGTISGGAGGTGSFRVGAAGFAVRFGAQAGTLIVDPGAVFVGHVMADAAVNDVLVLAGGGLGTLSGMGGNYSGFSTWIEDSGANWTLAGANSFGGTASIAGALTVVGALDVTGTMSAASALAVTGSLTVAAGAMLDSSGKAVTVAGYLLNKGSIIPGAGAIGAGLNGGVLTNDGMIGGGGGGYSSVYGGSGADGVDMAGGTLIDHGMITAGSGGGAAEVAGARGAGVALIGGTLTTDGTIMDGAGGFANNAGLGGAGVVLLTGGMLTNMAEIDGGAGGTGEGQGGLGGAVAGTKSDGVAGDTVLFGTAAATLVVDPGAAFVGDVTADAGVADVLVLAGHTAGTLDGLGSQFDGFSTLDFAAGASWTVDGTPASLDGGQVINGFTVGDTINLDGFAFNPADTTYVAGVGLELTDTNGVNITLDIVEPAGVTTADFTVTDPQAVTTIVFMPCFAAGTRVLRADGRQMPVEVCRIGDALQLADGTAAPISWKGVRKLDLRRHPRPAEVQPILIAQGALGDGLPWRDLAVSPDHAMYVNGHLIPAKTLVNGFAIRQLNRTRVTYYHLELPAHGVIFAEGAAAESYLETGNRGAFENGGPAVMLHPDFANAQRLAKSCAPLVEDGPVVEAVRHGILERSSIETTGDPALAIFYKNGAAIITSRAAVPGEIFADPRDRRRLGVKIARIEIAGEAIRLDHPELRQGWHDIEPDGRWTDGRAVIPPNLIPPGAGITVELAAAMRYPITPAAPSHAPSAPDGSCNDQRNKSALIRARASKFAKHSRLRRALDRLRSEGH